MLQEKHQSHRSSRRVLPKVGQLGFRPSTFLALGITALPTSWRALLRGYQWFSLNKNEISSRTRAWKKVHAAGETAIVEHEMIFSVSTVIERAVLEMEAQLFQGFKRMHCGSIAESNATNSQALNLLDEQYKTFEKTPTQFFFKTYHKANSYTSRCYEAKPGTLMHQLLTHACRNFRNKETANELWIKSEMKPGGVMMPSGQSQNDSTHLKAEEVWITPGINLAKRPGRGG